MEAAALAEAAVDMEAVLETELSGQAFVLFGGRDLSAWMGVGETPPGWRVVEGTLEVVPGAGSLVSRALLADFQLHFEVWVPAPRAHDPRPSGGVALQGRYELHVAPSHGEEPGPRACGAIYEAHAPAWNACRPPETWEAFDVAFRAPCLDTNGQVVQHARVTVFHNGLMIHDNVALAGPTPGALDRYEALPGPICLQDRGAPVRYRNIWVVAVAPAC